MNKEYETYVEALDFKEFQEMLSLEMLEEITEIIHSSGKIIGNTL